ncbi:hypothetical protein P7C73_g5783, partial [Tremellales sp. Uapishka_1]
PSLLSAFSANTLLTSRRLRLIASMFSQMCEAVAVCHDAGVSHRDIKPENFICCDSVELESAETDGEDFGPQAKRMVVVKLTDFGLATTEEESGDVECGSKPYMSYECRNNLGPTYLPGPADVWSLGIVLINMLFHRNPWKDPTQGDMNFDNFLNDPVGFLLAKFTGIGREVASYIAERVLCVEVEDRVSARELGNWIKSLPDMIGGRSALRDLRITRLETRNPDHGQGLFVKSPVDAREPNRKSSFTSALTSTAPGQMKSTPPSMAEPIFSTPTLSNLPPPSQMMEQDAAGLLPTPDLEVDEIKSATTVDEQPTPIDSSHYPSPEMDSVDATTRGDAESRSLSTTKRRKRGVRKGKAAQAALAAAAAGEGDDKPTQEERDALLKELATASQSLARDLSKVSSPLELSNEEAFPPLGTTPSQVAAKKSKWKDLLKSNGNPELAALARRVSERNDASGGNWSAPAQLQHQRKGYLDPHGQHKQTVTNSSGISSALSSFGPVSSATSSSTGGGPEDDDWRTGRGRERLNEGRRRIADQSASTSRSRQAAVAAAAITASLEPMGMFGRRPDYSARGVTTSAIPTSTTYVSVPPSANYGVRTSVPIASPTRPAARSNLSRVNEPLVPASSSKSIPSLIDTSTVSSSRPALSSNGSTSTIVEPSLVHSHLPGTSQSPNKPKLKGQIQSLAKMLSGLKTKGGKD